MLSRWVLRRAIALGLLGSTVTLWGISHAAERSNKIRPLGAPDEGLPVDASPIQAYSKDGGSPLNALHALLFLAERMPSEVGGVLPNERSADGADDAKFYQRGWYFRKRPGRPGDQHAFGGDVRVSPVDKYSPEEQERLEKLLADLATPTQVESFPELKNPIARLMLQWDILSVWWRLERSPGSTNPKALFTMAKAIVALGQDRKTLSTLDDGRDLLISQFSAGKPDDRKSPYLPAKLLGQDPTSPWIEIDRTSSTLFHGTSSFRSSRVFLNAGTAEKSRSMIEAAAKAGEAKERPAPAGLGTETALVLTLVGVSPQLEPIATPVIDEVRVRAVVGPAVLTASSDTTTHDGLNQWVYFRSREGSLNDKDHSSFRFVPDSSQSLFLEYGTAKWTTFAAQCTLCHRATNDGGQAPSGIRSLGRSARPRVATDGKARDRLTEVEFAPIMAKLKERLDTQAPVGEKP